ncbi:dienelactone hydrolase family protein [Allosphingosinicella indica]|uniref:Carboxymethylenebutenolidase n=1 Tax=Allosphingosinicella indica TaxID=941907 RepID=A0A1X7GEY4_9SPHN|nr:dienelactone hydrolase family protein [Allosphingosinicella indica]SMF68635.1 carboxymethylenebutenolidase [Allosphingosinicella indica]
MNPETRAAAVALYDRFTHEGMDRRVFMERLTRIAGGAAAANALLLAIAADPAAAAITKADDPRLVIKKGSLGLKGIALDGYVAAPKDAKGKLPALIVVHENRGLNAHIEDVARRFALEGFFTVAPDFLTPAGGTPADEDAARAAIGKLDYDAALAAAIAEIDALKALASTNGKVGVVGYCWGGAFVNRLAVAAGDRLSAGVSYYGPAPATSEAAKVSAPLLIQLAGRDARVNATAEPWAAALKAAGKQVQAVTYPDVDHAFNNDTSAERYNKAAADKAWAASIAFFRQHLA